MNIITFSDRLSKFMMILAAAWTFAISFLVLGDIVGRSVFDAPIHGTAEMVAAVGRLPEGTDCRAHAPHLETRPGNGSSGLGEEI